MGMDHIFKFITVRLADDAAEPAQPSEPVKPVKEVA